MGSWCVLLWQLWAAVIKDGEILRRYLDAPTEWQNRCGLICLESWIFVAQSDGNQSFFQGVIVILSPVFGRESLLILRIFVGHPVSHLSTLKIYQKPGMAIKIFFDRLNQNAANKPFILKVEKFFMLAYQLLRFPWCDMACWCPIVSIKNPILASIDFQEIIVENSIDFEIDVHEFPVS